MRIQMCTDSPGCILLSPLIVAPMLARGYGAFKCAAICKLPVRPCPQLRHLRRPCAKKIERSSYFHRWQQRKVSTITGTPGTVERNGL